MNFDALITTCVQADTLLRRRAVVAVSQSALLRNWVFGYGIVEYEQHGEDRAIYGERLLERTAATLKDRGVRGLSVTTLKLCRQIYQTYPEIGQTLSDQFVLRLGDELSLPTLKPVSQIRQTLSDQLAIPVEQMQNHVKRMLGMLSFSHFVELVQVDDPVKRLFYEIECVGGNWSVRELRRQVGSLLYERTGLSRDKERLVRMAASPTGERSVLDHLRDPYVFEFLGLTTHDVLKEQALEATLLDHLEQFLLELGKGFCFEARQRRITVDNQHHFVDLLFYHRILKCHVLIELKTEKFCHAHAGQLHFYLNYFKKYEMSAGDSPPVGILLCTAKDAEHVEFATAGLDTQLFVSKYKLALPTEDELKQFIVEEISALPKL